VRTDTPVSAGYSIPVWVLGDSVSGQTFTLDSGYFVEPDID